MGFPADMLPPQDQTAERAVLGSLLRDNAVIEDVACTLDAGDFYSDAHQRIYTAILSLRQGHSGSSACPVDAVLLADRLKEQGSIEDVGGYGYLAQVYDAAPTAANVQHYARIVRDKSRLRSLILAAREMLASAYSPTMPADDVLQAAEKAVFALGQRGANREARPIGPVMAEVVESLALRQQRPQEIMGVPTGIDALDALTAGLQPGEFTVIAARPSVGKTAVAAAVAKYVAHLGRTVLFCSLEQSKEEVATRLLVADSGVSGQIVRHAACTLDEITRLADSATRMQELPVLLDDAPAQSILRIVSAARRFKRSHALALVIVDYLQLIEPEDRQIPRHEQVAGISRRLKFLARELKIPVVALAQLNRDSENRVGQKPRLSDLRESGGIEADADMVVLLHRPGDSLDRLEMNVAKQRNGPVGEFTVWFDRAHMRFREVFEEREVREL